MRSVYKNPRELAIHLKDLVDQYLEELLAYEKLEDRVVKIIKANEGSVYKEGFMPVKLSNVLGDERKAIVDKIAKDSNLI